MQAYEFYKTSLIKVISVYGRFRDRQQGVIIMKATEIFREIKTMDNGERIKLLSMLFDEYFDSRPPQSVINEEKIKNAWGEWDE